MLNSKKNDWFIPDDVPVDENGIPILKELPLDRVGADFTVVVYGIRRTGKSFFARWLMYNLASKFPFVLIHTETKYNKFWSPHAPDRFILEGFSDTTIGKFIELQGKECLAFGEDPLYNVCKANIFDDCIGDKHMRTSPNLDRLFILGRHIKNFTLVCTQTAKGVNPTLRTNCDLAVMLKMFSKMHRDSLIEDYLDFMPRTLGLSLMQKYTDDRKALCVFNSSISNNPWENIFYCIADDPGDFILGCREYWEGSGDCGNREI